MKSETKRRICLCVALLSILLLAACEIFKFSSLFGEGISNETAQNIDMISTRFLGGTAFFAMLVNLGYKVLDPFKKPFFKSLLFALPAFLIALNNFPFSTVLKGEADINADPTAVILLLFECLCVGFFEETAFRGVVFLTLLKKDRENRLWAFWSIAISSAVFGLVHLVNLIESSPAAVLMQIGYSALIGAMCSVILMKSANIWLCVAVHGLFNFCGALVPRLGQGVIWDAFTIVLTVIASIAVTVYMVMLFIKDEMKSVKDIYIMKR